MTYKEVFEIEERNTNEELCEIHFYKEGLWWKAFEWSVYLYVHFMTKIIDEDKKILNLLKNYTIQHSDGSIIIIGMPIEAFDNFLPDMNDFRVVSDTEIIYDLSKHSDIVSEIRKDINLDNYSDILSSWKEEQPFTEASTKRKKIRKENAIAIQKTEDIENPITNIYKDIVEKIKNYPLESKTPMDNTLFLIGIRNELLKLK